MVGAALKGGRGGHPREQRGHPAHRVPRGHAARRNGTTSSRSTCPPLSTRCACTLPHMAQAGFGRVVNIASVHGLVASVNKAPYVAAKFGLVGMSRVAALEYASAGSRESGGVTVNCICPGWTETAIIQPQIDARAQQLGTGREAAIRDLLQGKAAQPAHLAARRDRAAWPWSGCASPPRTTSPAPRFRWTGAGRRMNDSSHPRRQRHETAFRHLCTTDLGARCGGCGGSDDGPPISTCRGDDAAFGDDVLRDCTVQRATTNLLTAGLGRSGLVSTAPTPTYADPLNPPRSSCAATRSRPTIARSSIAP